MKPRVTLAVLAAVVIALLWWRQTHEPLSYYSSRSYVERVNALIDKSALEYDPPSDRIRITERATDAERKWYEASYLATDVELYNRNRELFGHFFVVRDGVLQEINPFLRTIRLPFATTLQWMGNIEYAGPGAEASLLSSNGRTIAVNRPSPDAPYVESRTPVGSNRDVAAQSILLDFAGGAQTPGVELHGVGDQAVLEQRVKSNHRAEVRVLGNAVPRGRIARLATGDWLHLASPDPAERSETFLFTAERTYDRLSVVRTRNARQERTFTETEPLLRWVGGEQGEEMVSFGAALARSISNALQQLDEERGQKLSTEFDVQLSIDRHLQSALDQALRERATQLVQSIAGGDPFAASMTVMNGKTGEIVAAVSFPAESDLGSSRTLGEEERRRLLVNHNFRRHPIGSAGKPFLYAAIASRHPFLLGLTVPPHAPKLLPDGEFEGEKEVLQFLLPDDYQLGTHSDAPIDFESALERSCNKYTVELGTLALAARRDIDENAATLDRYFVRQPVQWPSGQSGVAINGTPLDFAPSLGPYMKDDWTPVDPAEETTAALRPGRLDRVDEAPFIVSLSEITGARFYRGEAAPDIDEQSPARTAQTAFLTMQYDLRPWSSLIEKLAAGQDREWKVRSQFQAVSPARVNLALNEVTNLRNDFVSLLLGGSTSQWTNIQLAEALSRLVTKRQVETSMVRAIHPHGNETVLRVQPRVFPPLALTDEARDSVLRGMRRVVLGVHGTAREMRDVVRQLEQQYPGYRVAFYSKTGSPTVERPEARPAGAILARMVTRGRLFYRDGKSSVSTDGRNIVPWARRGTPGREAFVQALNVAMRNAGNAVQQPHGPATLNGLLRFVDTFERYRSSLYFASRGAVRLDERVSSPFYVAGGQVILNRSHPVFRPTYESDSSAAYIFSIVKWKSESADPDAVPTPAEIERDDSRVVTVALYLDIGPGSPVAVETARMVVPRLKPLLD
jgi:cell division protein FtsI/penicillin-binding protein 2